MLSQANTAEICSSSAAERTKHFFNIVKHSETSKKSFLSKKFLFFLCTPVTGFELTFLMVDVACVGTVWKGVWLYGTSLPVEKEDR
jgi:hypothetical protein